MFNTLSTDTRNDEGGSMSNVLVIGYGNPLRGDDAAGQVVARAVEQWHVPNVNVLVLHQLAPELAEDLARVTTVFFIDASSDVMLEYPRVTEIQLKPSPISVSHFSSPQDLLELAKQLYGCIPRAYQIEVPAKEFELNEGLSAKAQLGVSEVLEYLREALNATQIANQVTVSEKLLRHL
jgi:hydrogenase maturation protease